MATGPGTRSFAAPPSRLVLIVEDDRDTRSFYTTVLSTHGFRIDEAHNGFQALEKAIERHPALIVTDIAVPGLDGIELCRRLRADIRTRTIPVLGVTGYADRHYQDRAIEAGADRVLIKPCTEDRLLAEACALIALPAKQ